MGKRTADTTAHKRKKKKRRRARVVEVAFVDPGVAKDDRTSDRGAFMSASVRNVGRPVESRGFARRRRLERTDGGGGGGGSGAGSSGAGGDDEEELEHYRDFDSAWSAVKMLGVSQLKGREKREHEARRIVELGGRAPKAQKVPYKILVGMRRKQKERAQKKAAYERALGIISAKKTHDPGGPGKRGGPGGGRRKYGGGGKTRGWDAKGPRGLSGGTGRFKGGILTVDPSKFKKGRSQFGVGRRRR